MTSSSATVTRAVVCALVALLGGCRAATHPISARAAVAPEWPRPIVTVVRQPRAWGDTGRVSTIDVAVRDVHQPTHEIPVATVLLDGSTHLALQTDDHGVAHGRSLQPGEYRLTIRRIGYIPLETRVTLDAGCRISVEAYLTFLACDLGPCPAVDPPRVTVTTCGARGKG